MSKNQKEQNLRYRQYLGGRSIRKALDCRFQKQKIREASTAAQIVGRRGSMLCPACRASINRRRPAIGFKALPVQKK